VYAVGHLALGYITGKTVSKATKASINMPLIFALSILPDIDLILIPRMHRGPTHSLVLLAALAVPLLLWRIRIMPYVVAYAQHILIGDLIAGPTQILWPLSLEWFGLDIAMGSPIEVALEWIFFLFSLILMIMLGDFRKLLKPHLSNLLFIVPWMGAGSLFVQMRLIVIPFMMRQISYYSYSTQLVIPQVFYFIYFSLAIIISLWKLISSRIPSKAKSTSDTNKQQ
jgi:hypothetical protein